MTPGAAAYPDLFNDVFGPVMQPGSSSHTAAPCRLGRLAGDLLGEPVAAIRIELDERGSFAGTFGVMSEDRAMVAGVLGMGPDDVGLFRAFELAAEAGATVAFEFTHLTESDHPNAMKFVLTGRSGRTVTLVGTSTGGGMVETLVVDGFALRTIGDAYVVLIFEADAARGSDPASSPEASTASDAALAARLAAPLPGLVASTTVSAAGRGRLHAFSLSAEPDAEALAAAVAPARLAVLRPVLPVLRRAERAPQLFDTMTRWREVAEQRGEALWETALQYEIDASGWSRDQVVATMARLAALMRRQTHAAYDDGVVVPASPFKPDFTAPWARHVASGRALTGGVVAETIKLAYGAGAGIPGVETVPGPMGGGEATSTPRSPPCATRAASATTTCCTACSRPVEWA